ncbi:MAG: class I SAM-dependent methyltransferase [Candidatus Cyclonatronum sp.]|uniref:class I SAM-dependent methyltransferase n=1 Tax=Cyclonatronum sp. TaxID=3024185 RepID=UPI0025B7B48E|nr:class I SAM-dependent methyltransferase [Cyclonatronum sp.]MCC5935201.1 class I SAM-dependent methyltransferase [Balneolales bacterium]MCH8487121.1 class I SAM-dependent methyltransferase [Cyclonatronum sp.]
MSESGLPEATPPCPLCREAVNLRPFPGQDQRRYQLCLNCKLISVLPADRTDAQEEQHRYKTHNNGPEFEGHVRFLMNAIEPALPYLKPGSRGLDYGCGHVPTLSVLLNRRGFDCLDYDLYFFPELPAGPFDFIFSTETFEHFGEPAADISRIAALLRPGGILTVMTLFWQSEEMFLKHFYFRDTTHFVFYHEDTMQWIAKTYGLELLFSDAYRVMVFRKKG